MTEHRGAKNQSHQPTLIQILPIAIALISLIGSGAFFVSSLQGQIDTIRAVKAEKIDGIYADIRRLEDQYRDIEDLLKELSTLMPVINSRQQNVLKIVEELKERINEKDKYEKLN